MAFVRSFKLLKTTTCATARFRFSTVAAARPVPVPGMRQPFVQPLYQQQRDISFFRCFGSDVKSKISREKMMSDSGKVNAGEELVKRLKSDSSKVNEAKLPVLIRANRWKPSSMVMIALIIISMGWAMISDKEIKELERQLKIIEEETQQEEKRQVDEEEIKGKQIGEEGRMKKTTIV